MPPMDYEDIYSRLQSGKINVTQALRYLRQNRTGLAPEGKSSVASSHSSSDDGPDLQEIMREIESLVGLARIKRLIGELEAFIEIQKRRKEEMLATEPLVLHMVFKGNPGTGKTTVARLLSGALKGMGVLSKGHLVEVERADLVGEYIGHTAQRTRELIKRAMGGILFIDEAYSLVRGGEKDFGKEAIDALVKSMEDHKGNLIVVLAGYRHEMEDFLRVNPGLRSRFPIIFDFDDYTIEELLSIARHMLNRRQYTLKRDTEARLGAILSRSLYRDKENFGNARLVRNLIERAMRKQAVRLVKRQQCSREELMLILPEDLTEDDI